MAFHRSLASLAVMALLSSCGPHKAGGFSGSSPTAKAGRKPMYIPEGMKDQQYAIRLGDSIRRKLGGTTVTSGRFVTTSPALAARNPYRNVLETRRIRGQASLSSDPDMVVMRVGGRSKAAPTAQATPQPVIRPGTE